MLRILDNGLDVLRNNLIYPWRILTNVGHFSNVFKSPPKHCKMFITRSRMRTIVLHTVDLNSSDITSQIHLDKIVANF